MNPIILIPLKLAGFYILLLAEANFDQLRRTVEPSQRLAQDQLVDRPTWNARAAAFLSSKGELTARIEAELDQRLTQRLILQPRAEISFSAQDIPELGVGSGIERIELGIRLRYEIKREFVPYIGIEQEWLLGGSADYARAAGEDSSVLNLVAGIRFWF